MYDPELYVGAYRPRHPASTAASNEGWRTTKFSDAAGVSLPPDAETRVVRFIFPHLCAFKILVWTRSHGTN